MATNGQFCWPSVGSSVAAYGQFGMAANSLVAHCEKVAFTRCPSFQET